MSKFPVNRNDPDSIIQAVNYVLSGPSGLGQPRDGIIVNSTAFITGNYRKPYSSTTYSPWYVAPIALGASTWLDDYTWRYDFAVAEPVPPFTVGNNIYVTGVTPADYNDYYDEIGVIECTTTGVTVRSTIPYPNPGSAGTGGLVQLAVAYFANPTLDEAVTISTDCQALVDVTGSQETVNLSAYITGREATGIEAEVYVPGTMVFAVEINRYRATNEGSIATPKYLYEFDKTIVTQPQTLVYTGATQDAVVTFSITSGTKVATTGDFYTIADYQVTGSGSGAGVSMNIQFNTSGSAAYSSTNTDIVLVTDGWLWAVGDTMTILGSDLGGVDGVNNLVLTVNSVGASFLVNPDINLETPFPTVLDQPGLGSWLYILELAFVPVDSTIDILYTSCEVGRRSISAQVVRQ